MVQACWRRGTVGAVGLGKVLRWDCYIGPSLPHSVSMARLLTPQSSESSRSVRRRFRRWPCTGRGWGNTVAGVACWVLFRGRRRLCRGSPPPPVIIGGAARLPFLWVLLGESRLGGDFGTVGLLLGPAVRAALISLWRDWTDMAAARRPRGMRFRLLDMK